jgi:LacI family transcriptional regulator
MATIKDVARLAGVSVATVSRVFNDSSLVSEPTRTRVRGVASRLNYWPNGAARSLITNRTHAVGVLLPDLFGEFFSEVIRGIDLTARTAGLHVLLSSSHADSDELIAAMRTMRGRIDGLIVMAPDVDAAEAIRTSGIEFPLVLIDPATEIDGHDTVAIANDQGAHEMVKHLLGLGHRRIAMITGPERNNDSRQRLAGYRQALRRARAWDAALEIPGDFSEPSGYAAAQKLLAIHPRPSAVFAANDYMAIGAIGALHDAGVRVPHDIAVTGFDDIAMSRYLNPPLTTVHVDAYRLGERAAQRLIGAGEVGDGGHHEVLPTSLVIRGSCGAVGSRDLRRGAGSSRGR